MVLYSPSPPPVAPSPRPAPPPEVGAGRGARGVSGWLPSDVLRMLGAVDGDGGELRDEVAPCLGERRAAPYTRPTLGLLTTPTPPELHSLPSPPPSSRSSPLRPAAPRCAPLRPARRQSAPERGLRARIYRGLCLLRPPLAELSERRVMSLVSGLCRVTSTRASSCTSS